MQYQITDYVFDDETLMLFKHDEALRFRTSEAKLLAFFLHNSDAIVSKETILDAVWAGKVVSEQVVFQNISHLRALFGDAAIKTYPKKGYQWQLGFQVTSQTAKTAEIHAATPSTTGSRSSRVWLGALLLCSVLILVSSIFALQKPSDTERSIISSISVLPLLIEPGTENVNALRAEALVALWKPMAEQGGYHPVAQGTVKAHRDIFSEPYKYYHSISEAHHSDYVLGTSIGKRRGRYFVRYILIGKESFWSEELESTSLKQLKENLAAHLARVIQSKVLEVDASHHTNVNAKLTELYAQFPNDLIVLYRLIRNHSENGAANKALLLAQELLTKSRDLSRGKSFEALAYLQQALAYIHLEQITRAETQLVKAEAIFNQHNNYRALIAVHHAYMSIAFADDFNYVQIKVAALSAIENARKAQDIVAEFRDTILLSHIAGNLHRKEDQVLYLRQAKLLINQHQMSPDYYAIFFLYAGIHTQDEVLAEQHFRRALDLLPEGHEWSERDKAREKLVELFITQQRWEDAIVLFSHESPKTPEHELTLAAIYASQQDWPKAEAKGLLAFKASSLDSQYRVALDSALFLAELYHAQNKQDDKHHYIEFIKKEYKSEVFWGSYNIGRLKKLGVQLEIEAVFTLDDRLE